MVKTHKSCSFLGHRKVNLSNEQISNLKKLIEDLIINQNVTNFLFGSRSEFISICYDIVTELKSKYNYLIRKYYTCTHEKCVFEYEKAKIEKAYLAVVKEKLHLRAMEEEVNFSKKYTAGKLSYVERNEAIIDDSDYCIFYYNKDYKPQSTYKYASITSGTKLSYEYAIKKKKRIINVFIQ